MSTEDSPFQIQGQEEEERTTNTLLPQEEKQGKEEAYYTRSLNSYFTFARSFLKRIQMLKTFLKFIYISLFCLFTGFFNVGNRHLILVFVYHLLFDPLYATR
jgi:hypothetical protein